MGCGSFKMLFLVKYKNSRVQLAGLGVWLRLILVWIGWLLGWEFVCVWEEEGALCQGGY